MSSTGTNTEFLELRHLLQCDNPSCRKMNPPHRCARCQCSYYCSVVCQKSHWSTAHKHVCRNTEELHAAEMADMALPPDAVAIPATAACGLCHEDAMPFPVALSKCGHAFCFKCISIHQGRSGFLLENKACPTCGAHTEKHIVQEALKKADTYMKRREFVMDDDDVKGCNEMNRLAMVEIDKVLDVGGIEGQAKIMLAKVLEHTDPHEAINMYKELIALTGEANGIVSDMDAQDVTSKLMEMAIRSGQVDVARQFMGLAELLTQDDTGKEGNWPHQLGLARSYEAAHLYNKALAEYEKVNRQMDPKGVFSANKLRFSQMARFGLSRCYYALGDCENALSAACTFVNNERRVAGAHQIMAKILLAMSKQLDMAGNSFEASTGTTVERYKATLDGAIEVMYKGFAYEEPWYDKNMRANRAFLQELLAMKASSSTETESADHALPNNTRTKGKNKKRTRKAK